MGYLALRLIILICVYFGFAESNKCSGKPVISPSVIKNGCWKLFESNCQFISPCPDKKKRKKFKCRRRKNHGASFCTLCKKCECRGKKALCSVVKRSCELLLKVPFQGCVRSIKNRCRLVFPCVMPIRDCIDGAKKCEACNTCTCVGGRYRCTRKACTYCPGNCWKMTNQGCLCKSICPGAEAPFILKNPCNPGQVTCSLCNKCFCGDDRKWACTIKHCSRDCPVNCWGFNANKQCVCMAGDNCDGTNGELSCIPNKQRCCQCNSCVCNAAGLWISTAVACLTPCPSDCWVFTGTGPPCECRGMCL